ncbi:MAG: BON domain-containing protein [Vicinamibacterales bacterium]
MARGEQNPGNPGTAAVPSDAQIKAEVERRLAELRPRPKLKVTVAATVVTLSGTVPDAWAKREAIDAARRAAGLTFVVSEIEIPRADSDAALALDVGQELLRSPIYSVFDDVTGGVRDGVVTLRGRVISASKVERLGELVARIRGVQAVNNEIREMATSISDDQLRWAVAQGIYGDAMFLNINMVTMPPIHIVVENGRVTLIGRVHTEIEKQRAGTIAQSIAGPARVENQLRVDKR